MADGTTESLFLGFPSYDHHKRIRRESHLTAINVANSFSYSSGFELSSPHYAGNTYGSSETNIGFMESQPVSQIECDASYTDSRSFEAFYDSLNTNGFSSALGMGSGLQGNARSIQNGKTLRVIFS